MSKIHAIEILSVGDRSIMQTTEDSIATRYSTSGGTEPVTFERGSVLVATSSDVVVSEVVTMQGAQDLARLVLEGDTRTVTSAKALITLAGVVLALLGPKVIEPQDPTELQMEQN